jgi:copper homeostasis protein
MAGSGVSAGNIPEIHAKTGIRHFHLSGKATEPGPMEFRREGVPMGLPMASEFDRQYTDGNAVKNARNVIDSLK